MYSYFEMFERSVMCNSALEDPDTPLCSLRIRLYMHVWQGALDFGSCGSVLGAEQV